MLFAHSTSPLERVLASQGNDHDKAWRLYYPLPVCTLRVIAAMFEARTSRWSVSRGSWADPFLHFVFFCDLKMTCCSVSQKVYTGTKVRAQKLANHPRPKRQLEIWTHLRPSNCAVRTLRSVEHTRLPSLVTIPAL